MTDQIPPPENMPIFNLAIALGDTTILHAQARHTPTGELEAQIVAMPEQPADPPVPDPLTYILLAVAEALNSIRMEQTEDKLIVPSKKLILPDDVAQN